MKISLNIGIPQDSFVTSMSGLLQGVSGGSLTFLKDYSLPGLISADADHSLGSPTATFTASRDATHPATTIETQDGNALLFDGVNDSVITTNNITNSGAMSVYVDIEFTTVSGPYTLIMSHGVYEDGFWIGTDMEGHVIFRHRSANSDVFNKRVITSYALGVNYSILVNYDTAGTIGVYLNNIEKANEAATVNSETNKIGIGSLAVPGAYSAVVVKDFAYWTKTLTSAERNDLFAGNVPTDSLAGHWDFSDGSGSTLTDIVGGNNGTITGAKWLTNGSQYITKVTASNTPRFTQGYYDATGYHSAPGLLIEGARTNLLTHGIFDAGTTLATGWGFADDVTDSPTFSLVSEDLTNISGSQAQRIVYTSVADPGSYIFFYQASAVGTFSQNDYMTFSFWAKGTIANATLAVRVTERDASSVAGTVRNGDDIVPSLSSTEWRRFYYTVQLTDADLSLATVYLNFGAISENVNIDIQIAGAQLEKSPYATSFCPTQASALTRNAEVDKGVNAGNATEATETVFIKYTPSWAGADPSNAVCLLSSDTKSRQIALVAASDSVAAYPNITDDATDLALQTLDPAKNTTYVLSASFQHASPYVEVYSNGVSQGTYTTDDFTATGWGDYFYIGSDNAGANQINGIVHSVARFNKVLTATEHLAVYNLLNQ